MAGTGTRVGAAVGVAALLAGGGYLLADAHDLVPGVVTLAPPHQPPEPFPTVAAAVEPPPVLPVLGALDGEAPLPDAGLVTAQATAAAAHPWTGTSVGVVVTDALTGEVLTDLGGQVPRTPASTAKLLTAVAAVRALGPETTVPTRVVQEGPGALVLVGGGDMMLAGGEGNPAATNGRAGLADLARQVAQSVRLTGADTVTLDVDDTLFSGPDLAPGWNPSHLVNGFVAPVAPLAVNIAKTVEAPYPPRHRDPALHAAQTLAEHLAAEGVAVARPPGRAVATPGAAEVGVVRSAPVRDVVAFALQTSDNAVTEALGRLVAVARGLPASFEGATRAVVAEVAAAGVDVSGAVLADCSGLADGSSIAARTVTDVLLTAVAEPQLLPVVVELPVGGWQGTMADRFLEPPARGLVRAKTGSLAGVTSLAGTVTTAQGRLLVFTVMADATPPGGQLGPRRVIDAFVQQLAGCDDCRLP